MRAAVVIVLLTSQLPDPGQPGTIGLAGLLGSFTGSLLAYVRGRSSETGRDLVRLGMTIGVGTGLVAWLAGFAIDRL